jgi:hypothetical protein
VVGFLEEQSLSLVHRRHRVSAAWRHDGVVQGRHCSMTDLVRGFVSVDHLGDGAAERGDL